MNAPLPVAALTEPTPAWQLKRLTPKHKQVAALLAQGLGREEIASVIGFRPEYITMLGKQDLFIAYIAEMNKLVDTRLQALYGQGVDTIATVMKNGAEDNKLKAAGMALKALGKDGSVVDKTTVRMQFIVKVPAKAASADDWAALHGRVLEHAK